MTHVWVVEWSDACTREYSIIAVFPGTDAGERAAKAEAKRLCDERGDSGYDVERRAIREVQE